MNPATELARAVLTALETIDGLRPSTPSTVPAASWVPWDWDTMAVDIQDELLSVRVVATRLPLPALLRQAHEAISSALAGTEWADTPLRLVVTDVDRAAFKRDSHHTNEP
ncbi:hypothetical protein [Kibdelosporangium aridum]|uniref:Asp23/Gls24 family envelope stress response protein n=1 Tax=Kibdelosporangium aridum TaxID=2030 RepID=A0A1W2FW38_KIBAR|nr:hypothetical protein [Kibdelosporangium aridum]SMD25942.1 hypothetical protein SAMN05661093_09520 [Kibdelosporangium aridum]